jgi:hypothetical protein
MNNYFATLAVRAWRGIIDSSFHPWKNLKIPELRIQGFSQKIHTHPIKRKKVRERNNSVRDFCPVFTEQEQKKPHFLFSDDYY